MEYVVLDTCIVMHIMRNDSKGQEATRYLDDRADNPVIVISAVTKGELLSLTIQRQWGQDKRRFIQDFLRSVTIVDINHTDNDLMNAYAAMDAYSKGKGSDPDGNSKAGSSVTMGKNDLWIAATARVLNATLLTADGDFDHLADVFLKIEKK